MAISSMWWNSPLARNIRRQSSHRSRFEIDRELLADGYTPQQIEAAWQLVNPTSPQAVEAAWQVLGNAPRQFWLKPLPKNRRWLYFGFLVGAAILAFLPGLFLNFWPLIHYVSVLGGVGIAFNLGAFIFWFWQNRLLHQAAYKPSYSLYTAIVISFIAIFAYVLVCLFANPKEYKDVASITLSGKDYHLVYKRGCFESCYEQVFLYRCDLFNLVCPNKDYLLSDDIVSRIGPSDSLTLAYDPATNKVNLLKAGRVIYSFNP